MKKLQRPLKKNNLFLILPYSHQATTKLSILLFTFKIHFIHFFFLQKLPKIAETSKTMQKYIKIFSLFSFQSHLLRLAMLIVCVLHHKILHAQKTQYFFYFLYNIVHTWSLTCFCPLTMYPGYPSKTANIDLIHCFQ